MITILICFSILIALGIIEYIKNKKNIDKISIRINVNGIRGKSTVTRLVSAVLTEAGFETIGKTTGTSPRIIHSDGREVAISRKPEGPNIKEQMKVINYATKYNAEAMVCECMAIRSEYQDIYQNTMLKANICVIVNVLEDHLDDIGPTTDEIAKAFSYTIPYDGKLIIDDGPYKEYFLEVAGERNTEVFVADSSEVPEDYLDQFNYILFPENISLALAVAQSLGIDKNVALTGMLKANPDPGAAQIVSLGKEWDGAYFVNAFAANEPESTIKIWEKVCETTDLPVQKPVILFNGRPDRVDRTKLFLSECFDYFEDATLVGMGQGIRAIEEAMRTDGWSGISEYLDLENYSVDRVIKELKKIMQGRVLFGIGNIHGDAEPLIDKLMEYSVTYARSIHRRVKVEEKVMNTENLDSNLEDTKDFVINKKALEQYAYSNKKQTGTDKESEEADSELDDQYAELTSMIEFIRE